MASVSQQGSARGSGAGWFSTTHWSVVLAASHDSSPGAQAALEQLCRTYWFPLYAYVRRRGHRPEDAEDLTQEFFARFLEKRLLGKADPERGRFRTFLLTSLNHFLINEWERATAQKRGGGQTRLPLDSLGAETLYGQQLAHHLTAEKLYEQSWALAVLRRVRELAREEFEATGRPEDFTRLEQFLPGQKGELTYAEAARQARVAEGTIKSDVNRLKKRYRELLRAEIAHTVASPAEINEELRHLLAVVSET